MSVEPVEADLWFTGYLWDTTKEAALGSIPIVSLAMATIGIIGSYFPLSMCDESIEDEDSDSFRVTPEQKERLADLYIQRQIRFLGAEGKRDLEKTIQEIFRKFFVELIDSFSEVVDRLNVKLGTSTALCVELPAEKEEFFSALFPFRTVGGKASRDSDGVILYKPTHVTVNLEELEKMEESEQERFIQWLAATLQSRYRDTKDFVIAHEFSHIAHSDEIFRATMKVVSAAASMIPWVTAWSLPISWGGYVVYALSCSFMTQMFAKVGESTIARRQEKRADLEAMQELGTNEGAVAFFSLLAKLPTLDYLHPTAKERLQYAQKWKPALS